MLKDFSKSATISVGIVCLLASVRHVGATDRPADALATAPQMGWNSGNAFKANIDEELITNTGALMVSLGLKDAGYSYLILDEGWQAQTRDPTTQRQRENTTLFPSGVPALTSKLHDLGLRVGIYSDAGIYDCAFFPGSWGNEELDAQTYAEWGIDYLKYDNCGQFQAAIYSPYDRFAVMRDALRASGRSIFYSMCSWGNQCAWFWADQVAHSFRMSGDIHLAFAEDSANVCKTAYCLNQGYAGCSVATIIRKMRELSPFQKSGAWLDMDMLEVGNTQKGQAVLNPAQERTHFSFWSALKSPLIIGADLRNISQSSLAILKNRQVIALNQDRLGVAARYIEGLSKEGVYQVWAGPLVDDRMVILVFNDGAQSGCNITLALDTVHQALQNSTVASPPHKEWHSAHELWTDREYKVKGNSLEVSSVAWNDTGVFVLY